MGLQRTVLSQPLEELGVQRQNLGLPDLLAQDVAQRNLRDLLLNVEEDAAIVANEVPHPLVAQPLDAI
eukprot:11192299-Lingulodinium_polyedra.AAC.1